VIFEWSAAKADRNLKKHGIAFTEAASVFLDPLAMTYEDPAHAADERREITIGRTIGGRLVFVSHCERNGRIRIISAREVTHNERKSYEEGATEAF
jgi:uncharacterized DUF497 family protein